MALFFFGGGKVETKGRRVRGDLVSNFYRRTEEGAAKEGLRKGKESAAEGVLRLKSVRRVEGEALGIGEGVE